jgi:hypothetical protein
MIILLNLILFLVLDFGWLLIIAIQKNVYEIKMQAESNVYVCMTRYLIFFLEHVTTFRMI